MEKSNSGYKKNFKNHNLLKDGQKIYGYEITQKVKELTSEKIQITEEALYPTLHAPEK